MDTQGDQKSICIIGAGPAGLGALKIILDSPQYKASHWKPVAFESRDEIGGIWFPAPPTDDPPLTPLYDSLTTNIPHPIMAFRNYPFPPSTPLFPRASIVRQYLNDYADQFCLRPHIWPKTTVTRVDWKGSHWNVELSTGETRRFDLVIVCNGHNRMPRYPDIPGVADWLASGRATHAAWYRRPEELNLSNTDIVLVVGGGASGRDIAVELCAVAQAVIHSAADASAQDFGKLKIRGRTTRFEGNGQVVFEDGTNQAGITRCVLATGYQYSFPFLNQELTRQGLFLPDREILPLPEKLHSNSTYNVLPLARHIFPLQTTFPPYSLAFIGLVRHLALFPLFETQARVVLCAFSNPACFDLTTELGHVTSRYERLRAQVGDDAQLIFKAWNRPGTNHYHDELYEFIHSRPDLMGEHAGGEREIADWERKFPSKSRILRKAWVALEKRGVAEEWVRDTGKNSSHEWVDLMERVLCWAEENEALSKA